LIFFGWPFDASLEPDTIGFNGVYALFTLGLPSVSNASSAGESLTPLSLFSQAISYLNCFSSFSFHSPALILNWRYDFIPMIPDPSVSV